MESLHYLLMKSQALFSRRVLGEASKLGLTPGQPKVLDYLMQYGEADQKTIAAYCEIEPATVGSILLRMEENGLIIRRQKAGNRRSIYVSLSEKGAQAARCMAEVFHSAECLATQAFSAEETAALKCALVALCSALAPYSEKEGREGH